MEEDFDKLSTNSIAFIGLASEYCKAVEAARESEPDAFIGTMSRLLPRLYIVATDIKTIPDADSYLYQSMDKDYYESVRHNMEMLLGPDDTYLEVFEADMKYSDTPISASIAEGLADIYQEMFNFIASVRDVPNLLANEMISACKEDFESFWGMTLCNVLRAIHNIIYSHE